MLYLLVFVRTEPRPSVPILSGSASLWPRLDPQAALPRLVIFSVPFIQPLYFQTVTHSFVRRTTCISFSFNHFRTLSITTEGVGGVLLTCHPFSQGALCLRGVPSSASVFLPFLSPSLLHMDHCPPTCPEPVGVAAYYPPKLFRISTYKSATKQTTLTISRINTYEKHRGWGVLWLTRLPIRESVLPAPSISGRSIATKDLSSYPKEDFHPDEHRDERVLPPSTSRRADVRPNSVPRDPQRVACSLQRIQRFSMIRGSAQYALIYRSAGILSAQRDERVAGQSHVYRR
jgi:hypothetical protein